MRGVSCGTGVVSEIALTSAGRCSWILLYFIFPELELHFLVFLHFFALLCHLCEFANVSFLHFCVTCIHVCTSVHFCVTSLHFSALQILLVMKPEDTSALILFVSKNAQTR